MNILHLSTFDIGGSAKATFRLHNNLLKLGYISKILIKKQRLDNEGVISAEKYRVTPQIDTTLNTPINRIKPDYCFFDRNISLQASQTINIKGLLNSIKFKPDIIIAHWISDFITIKDLYLLHKETDAPVVWYLMDMGPFTGGCHYAWDCKGYMNQCGNCPALYSSDPQDFSFQYLNIKFSHINKMNITAVAGTSMLADQALKSSLLKEKKISKIMLGIDGEIFKLSSKETARARLNLPNNKKIIFFGAQLINEKRKGMKYLSEALNKIANDDFFNNDEILLLSASQIPANEFEFNFLFPHIHANYINSDEILATVYQAADVFVCPSIEDSGPMMINEAIMCGTPVVSFEQGVSLELVHTGITGYRARLKDSMDLATGIKYILNLSSEEHENMSIRCNQLGIKLCDPQKQADSFKILFEELLSTSRKMPNVEKNQDEIIQFIKPYTMLSQERLNSLYQQIVFCEKSNIQGCYVECGVWKGGSVGLMALANLKYGKSRRHIHLFDAFDDICEPDAKIDGERALQDINRYAPGGGVAGKLAPLKGVYDSFGGHGTLEGNKELLEHKIGYDPQFLHYHKGWFQKTLPIDAQNIGEIAVLRLDGDWYASTKICLDFLYDKVVKNGFIIIDDYGYYEGCKKAVDEFIRYRNLSVCIHNIDSTGIYWIKSEFPVERIIPRMLNLGCGNIVRKDWVNIDFTSHHKDVLACNLRKGIPFPEGEFDVVYHSHVLEHFTKDEAFPFIKECFRVLKTKGIIRVVVPDLEGIVKEYLKWMESANKGLEKADSNYDWIMLELFDQTVRNYSGGEMGKYLSQENIPNKDFIAERIGDEFIEQFNANNFKIVKNTKPKQQILSEDAICYNIGLFRMGGEIHQWMYDRYSLSRLLRQAGFVNIEIKTALESNIPDFHKYELDTYKGKPRGASSLFIEALKP